MAASFGASLGAVPPGTIVVAQTSLAMPCRTGTHRNPLAAAGAAAFGKLGNTGFGLETLSSARDSGREGLRHPRLGQALAALRRGGKEQEDWRKVSAEELLTGFGESNDSDGRTLLATAIFVGTAQACMRGSYWAPGYGLPGAQEVDCKHVTRPVSCLYPPTKMPKQSAFEAHKREFIMRCEQQRSPLDVAAWILSSSVEDRHVAVLRFTRSGDRRNECVRYGHCTEDQIFLRTSYFQAFERMDGDINAPIGEALDDGGVIYTSNVGMLRGAVREGAPWMREPAKVDVIWISLPPRPQKGESRLGLQDWYANDDERSVVAMSLDLAFAWAAARGCDALVMPPVGCDSHGCVHPPLGVANIIHDTAQRYKRYLPQVCVASDYHSHHEEGWWERFDDVLQNGKQKPDPLVLVPPIHLPPCTLVRKDARQLLEKTRVLSSRGRPASVPRGTTPRGGPRRRPVHR